MRFRTSLAAASAALALACGGDATGRASCKDMVVVDGVNLYGGQWGTLAPLPPAGERIEAHSPICGTRAFRTTEMRRLQGVPASAALLPGGSQEDGGGVRLYLGEGWIPERPEHPLHRALYGSDSRPGKRLWRRCRAGATAAGVVQLVAPTGSVRVQGGRHSVHVRPYAGTVVVEARGRLPLRRGSEVRATGYRCSATSLVARRIVITRRR